MTTLASPREWLMIVEESAYKTPVGSPTVWTTSSTYGLTNASAYYVRLDEGNAYTMYSRPTGKVVVPYGGGFAVDAYAVSDKQEVKGQLKLKLCVSQAPFFLSWALQRINSGQTAPWTTTQLPGDLASCSIYHAVQCSDGTIKREVALGTKVDSANLTISEDSTVCTLTLNLSASEVQGNPFDSSSDPSAGTFPAPADNNFPVDPYLFIYAGGASYFTYNGAVRTQMTELNFSVANMLSRKYFASRFLQLLTLVGRRTTLGTKLLFPPSGQDDRTSYIQLSTNTCSIELNNGTHGFTLGMNAQNYLDPFDNDLPLNEVYMQSSTSNNLWDPSAGADLTLTIT